MDYIGPILVFLSALIAIRGETWDRDANGVRRVTTTGWITALLAIAGVLVAAHSTHESRLSAAANERRLIVATREAAAANATVQELRGRLAESHRVVTEVRDMSERQMQVVMAQYVTLEPGQVWNAPNSLFPGSVVKFMMWDAPIVLEYSGHVIPVRASADAPVELAIVGSSGARLSWLLRNTGTTATSGKVYLYSSPRGRSSDFSWQEEGDTRDAFFKRFVGFGLSAQRALPSSSEYQCRTSNEAVIVSGSNATKVLSCWADYGPNHPANAAESAATLKSRLFRYLSQAGYEAPLASDRSEPGWTNEVFRLVPRREAVQMYVQYESEGNQARTTGYAKVSLLLEEGE